MPAEIYEIVAQGARYWFLFLMALIVWRSYRWLRRDGKQRKKRLRLLPDAGYIGEMVVVKGSDALKAGAALLVPREGTLGYTRMNDLCVPVRGVQRRHTRFRFEPKTGLTLEPFFGKTVKVDGEERTGRRDPLSMAHGSRLCVGEAELRLRLFAGFEAPARFRVETDGEPDENEKDASPQTAAMSPEQLAAWRQQLFQQQYMQQMAYMQWMSGQWAAQAAAQGGAGAPQAVQAAPCGGQADCAPDGDGQADGWLSNEWDDAPEDGEAENGAEADDETAVSREAWSDAAFAPPRPFPQTEFETDAPFYPPAGSADEDDWPYAPMPLSDGQSADGCAWPENANDTDDDLTDAAAPPKSAYVGHDEAAEAKRRFWDRYLGGGDRP